MSETVVLDPATRNGLAEAWGLSPHARFAPLGNGLINRATWKFESWLQGYNGGPLRHPTARVYDRDMTALRRALEVAGLEPTSDPNKAYFVGRYPM